MPQNKKKRKKRQSKLPRDLDTITTKRWMNRDYSELATNMLAHMQAIDIRSALEQEYGDDAEPGDIKLNTIVDSDNIKRGINKSDAEIFYYVIHELMTAATECALDTIDTIKQSKFQEGVSSIHAALFSALADIYFLHKNFDVSTGALDVPSAVEGNMLIKKTAEFSSMLEGFKRHTKTQQFIKDLQKQLDQKIAYITELDATIKQLPAENKLSTKQQPDLQ